MKFMRGFTLIELLIVVAIIGILAAIAVPNFITAQVRARVARVQSELRSISDAMSAYQLDANQYPPMLDRNASLRHYRSSSFMTTPVAYISSLPADPFQSEKLAENTVSPGLFKRYRYHEVGILLREGDVTDIPVTREDLAAFGEWRLLSVGPDQEYQGYSVYDASNGALSDGDISLSARGANPILMKSVTGPIGSGTFR